MALVIVTQPAPADEPGALPPPRCAACFDPVPADGTGFSCPARPAEHVMCRPCFLRYTDSCASSYWSSVPLRCFDPACGSEVPDAEVRRLVGTEVELLDKYERATVRHALDHVGEDVVACRACSGFCAVYPRGHRHEARNLLKGPARPGEPDEHDNDDGGEPSGEGEEVEGKDGEDGAEGLTGFVFECADEACGARHCLGCDAALEGASAEGHECVHDRVRELAEAIHAALAEGGTRRCPACGLPGLKDLSCTHIRCDQCHTPWCYACGEHPGDASFRNHNQPFRLVEYGHGGRCPLYLKYAYGENTRDAESRLDGNPALSLRRFHTERQMRLVQELRERTADEDLWRICVEREFPGGLFEADDVAFLEARAARLEVLRAQEEERRRLAAEREEERRRRAEELVRLAQERFERLRRLEEEARRESAEKLARWRTAREEHRAGLRDFLRERRRAREQARGGHPAPGHDGSAALSQAAVLNGGE